MVLMLPDELAVTLRVVVAFASALEFENEVAVTFILAEAFTTAVEFDEVAVTSRFADTFPSELAFEDD
jgi:hypothetical protein